ncbi:unnamed protein product [Urochloa humidicola]
MVAGIWLVISSSPPIGAASFFIQASVHRISSLPAQKEEEEAAAISVPRELRGASATPGGSIWRIGEGGSQSPVLCFWWAYSDIFDTLQACKFQFFVVDF